MRGGECGEDAKFTVISSKLGQSEKRTESRLKEGNEETRRQECALSSTAVQNHGFLMRQQLMGFINVIILIIKMNNWNHSVLEKILMSCFLYIT